MCTILLPPRMKMVTAREFLHSSMTNIRSFVVPNVNSLTTPAWPSFSGVNSSKRGTIRPPVAMAISWKNNLILLCTSIYEIHNMIRRYRDYFRSHNLWIIGATARELDYWLSNFESIYIFLKVNITLTCEKTDTTKTKTNQFPELSHLLWHFFSSLEKYDNYKSIKVK